MPNLSVIFDLDGTLLDTLADLADTCNEVLAFYHYPTHPTDAFTTFVGDGLRILMQRITPTGTGEPEIQQCCALFTELYASNWKRNSCPYMGINAMLSALKKNGIMTAVLSNKPHEFTKLFINEFFPPDMFALAYGQRDGFPKKPDPKVALEIAEKLGTRPRRTLFVGDSGVDMKTGKAARMVTVGVSWGFRSVEELVENKADAIVHNPLELEQYVLSFL